MLDLYMVIVLLSCFVLIITAAGVITNRLVTKRINQKLSFYVCLSA